MIGYIIRLQEFDDLITVQEKLNWSHSEKVILVFPEKTEVKWSRVDFSLLNKTAINQGLLTMLVIKDGTMKENASASGFQVFRNLALAKKGLKLTERKPKIMANPVRGDGLSTMQIKKFFLDKKTSSTDIKRRDELKLLILMLLVLGGIVSTLWVLSLMGNPFYPWTGF